MGVCLGKNKPKSKPREIHYINYKKPDSLKLNVDLKNALFDEVFAKVLNRHAALKKKIVRVNDSSYISKTLWKAIMRTSYFEKKYFRKKKQRAYKEQKNYCSFSMV